MSNSEKSLKVRKVKAQEPQEGGQLFSDLGRLYSLYAQNIIDTVRDPMIVIKKDLRVLSANRSFYKIFHTEPSKTENRLIYDLGNKQWDIPKLRKLLEEILPTRMSFDDYEVEHQFPVIGKKVMLLNAREIKSSETPNREPLILLAFEDVTDRRRLEEERDQALNAREELVAVVSHELKNPLTTITSSLDLIKRVVAVEKYQEKVQKLFHNIYDASRRMTRITSDLIDVSKIEGGYFPLELAPVEVSILIEEVVTLSLPLALDKLIQIEKHVSKKVNLITCDRDRVAQSLLNLLNNAIKFSNEGGVICIEVDRVDDQIRFQVRDTGCGIPRDQLPHVFERFWQAKHKQYMGAGLGLYITKGIVEMHGGKVGVESKTGEGSAFYFTLPIAATTVRRSA